MTAIERIRQVAGAILKYGLLATAAVAQAQAEIGASNGDASIQQTKKQLAVTLVLAAAHAGESVPNATVQNIAGVVDLFANTSKALGLFGKTAVGSGSVDVPKAAKVE